MKELGIPTQELDTIIDRALCEDGAQQDSTVSFLGVGAVVLHAQQIAGANGVAAGLGVAARVFQRVDSDIDVQCHVEDGTRIGAGDVLASVNGSAAGILGAERVALNFLQRLSGIATLTADFVERLHGSGIEVLDTRKTTPLLRGLERYAVRVGGGKNHRFNLTDMILIKENHFSAAGGADAVRAILDRAQAPVPVEVEVDSLPLLRGILGAPVQQIMLDNFSPDQIRQGIAEITEYRRANPSFAPKIEASGGINLDNVGDYAIAGLDYISIGGLTHSAPALDISMEVRRDG